jgi:hypothetical protein
MLIYFFFGELDWMDIVNDNDIEDFGRENNYVRSKKELIINNTNIPKVMIDFYKNVRMLEFEERPNYEKYIDSFRKELNNYV